MFSQIFKIVAPALLLALALASSGHAQWKINGKLDEENASSVAVGDFGASLMLTDDHNGLFEAWNRPSSPDYDPNISVVDTAARGDIVLAFIILTGCEENSHGNCKLCPHYERSVT